MIGLWPLLILLVFVVAYSYVIKTMNNIENYTNKRVFDSYKDGYMPNIDSRTLVKNNVNDIRSKVHNSHYHNNEGYGIDDNGLHTHLPNQTDYVLDDYHIHNDNTITIRNDYRDIPKEALHNLDMSLLDNGEIKRDKRKVYDDLLNHNKNFDNDRNNIIADYQRVIRDSNNRGHFTHRDTDIYNFPYDQDSFDPSYFKSNGYIQSYNTSSNIFNNNSPFDDEFDSTVFRSPTKAVGLTSLENDIKKDVKDDLKKYIDKQIEKNTKDKKVSDSSLIESSNYSFTDSPLNLTSQEPNIPDDNMYILKSKILPPTCPVCPTLEKTKPVSYDVMKEMKYVEKDNFEKNMPMPLLNDFNKF